ncbi:cupin domain-containing protein [Micromonospora sp. M12]
MTLVRAAQAEVLESDPASVITLLLDPEHTGGALTSNRTLLKHGTDGAPPHLHTHSGELFFVLDGALEMLVGDELHTLHRGDTLFVPPGTRTPSPPPRAGTPTSWS